MWQEVARGATLSFVLFYLFIFFQFENRKKIDLFFEWLLGFV